MYYGAYDCGATIIRIKVGDQDRIIYGDDDCGGGYDHVRGASVCSLDDLPNQGTGNRHIIVAGSRTSRWPILTLSESQSIKC